MRQTIENLRDHIRDPHSLKEIIEKWESCEYNAELLLQHLLVKIQPNCTIK